MEWVGPLISGAAVVLVAIIEAVAARERNGGKTGGGPETTAHGAAGRDVTE